MLNSGGVGVIVFEHSGRRRSHIEIGEKTNPAPNRMSIMSHLPQRPELKAWYKALNDYEYRANSPDAYHRALLDGAKTLLSGGVIDWDQCEELKKLADSAHARAVLEAKAHLRRDPSA